MKLASDIKRFSKDFNKVLRTKKGAIMSSRSRGMKVMVAVSRSSRYGRPRIIAFGTKIQGSVEDAMAGLGKQGRYSLCWGRLVIDKKVK